MKQAQNAKNATPSPRKRLKERIAASAIFKFFFSNNDNAISTRRQELVRLHVAKRLSRWQQNPIHRLFIRLRRMFYMTELRSFSLLLLPMGLASVFRCLILPALTNDFPLLVGDGIAGSLILLTALFLLPTRGEVYRVANNDGLLAGFLYDTLSLPRPYASGQRPIPTLLQLVAGFGLGVASVFFSPLSITLILLACIFSLLSMISPDVCLILIGFLFPFTPLLTHGSEILAIAIGIGLLSYLIKLLLGKRAFSFGPLELFVLLFAALYAVVSLLHKSGATLEGVTAAFLIVGGYYLTANLLSSRRSILLLARAILCSTSVLAAIGVYHSIVTLTAPSWQESHPLLRLDSISTLLLENNTILIAFLLLLLPLLFSVVTETSHTAWRYLPSCLLLFAALGLSGSAGAYIGLLAAMILYLLLATRSHARWFLLLILILPNIPALLPPATQLELSSALSFLGDDFAATFQSCMTAQRASLLLLGRNLFGFGRGVRKSELAMRLWPHGYSGDSAYNLLLEIGLEVGVFGLVLFLLILLPTAKSTLSARSLAKENHLRLMTIGAASGIFSVLVLGAYAAIFESTRVLFLFFLMLGFLRATRRVALDDDAARQMSKAPAESSTASTEIRLSQQKSRR